MWDILHASAFLCDANGLSGDALIRPLVHLLPCIYCRKSFTSFYTSLGPPDAKHLAKWTYEVHKLVNRKLMAQRAEAFMRKRPDTCGPWLVQDSPELLSEPTFEALQKRFLVNRDEPIPRRSLLTTLLAIVMGLEGLKAQNQLTEYHKDALVSFLGALKNVIEVSSQHNSAQLLSDVNGLLKISFKDPSEIRLHIETLKYGTVPKHVLKSIPSGLIKAGACINGTCV